MYPHLCHCLANTIITIKWLDTIYLVFLYMFWSPSEVLFWKYTCRIVKETFHLICIVEKDRRVAKNFGGQGRFLQIRTQMFNSSIKLNYMETTQCASFKNSYLCQIQIIFSNKENPQMLQHFYWEKWKKFCLSFYTIYSTFNFQRLSNRNNNEFNISCF